MEKTREEMIAEMVCVRLSKLIQLSDQDLELHYMTKNKPNRLAAMATAVDIGKDYGVYAIFNRANNKFYIGSSSELRKRKIRHWYQLRHQSHENGHLQHAWNKYGESSFVFKVVEFTDRDNLIAREQYYLDLTESYNPQKGYNISKTAGSVLGLKQTQVRSGDEVITINVKEYAEKYNIPVSTLFARIRKYKDLEIALRLKPEPVEYIGKKISYHGETYTLPELCEKLQLNYLTIRHRVASGGLSVEEAVELIDIKEAARRTGVGMHTLRRWDKNGLLRSANRNGHKRMYDEKVLNEFIANDLENVLKMSHPVRYDDDGVLRTLPELSAKYGIHRDTLCYRLEKRGMSLREACNQPLGPTSKQHKLRMENHDKN